MKPEYSSFIFSMISVNLRPNWLRTPPHVLLVAAATSPTQNTLAKAMHKIVQALIIGVYHPRCHYIRI